MNPPCMGRRSRSQAGFTLVEVMVSLGIIVIVLVGLISTITFTTRHNAINRENLAAMRAAEQMLETLRSRNFADIFRLYAPGPTVGEFGPDFAVPGLTAPAGRPAVGRVIFPGTPNRVLPEGATGDADFDRALQLNVPANLTNQDLDLDGVFREPDVSASYQLLPVCLELSWVGISGPRTVRYYHFLRPRD